jgi:hypothetical protein
LTFAQRLIRRRRLLLPLLMLVIIITINQLCRSIDRSIKQPIIINMSSLIGSVKPERADHATTVSRPGRKSLFISCCMQYRLDQIRIL